jgi:AbrB family looped-hinge helix DNA binding protein
MKPHLSDKIILPVRQKEQSMDHLATTRMSSKGQIVIPESIRKRLNLKEGAQFIVVGEGDVVILKAITPPKISSFDALIEQARQQAAESGLDFSDIENAIKKARTTK